MKRLVAVTILTVALLFFAVGFALQPSKKLLSLNDQITIGMPESKLESILTDNELSFSHWDGNSWTFLNRTSQIPSLYFSDREVFSTLCRSLECRVVSASRTQYPLFGLGLLKHQFEYHWGIAEGKVSGALENNRFFLSDLL